MGKEVKIGLAVIGVLLCIFGGVLAMRLKRQQPANALEKVAAAEKEGKIGGKKKAAKSDKDGKQERFEPNKLALEPPLEEPLSSRSRRGNSKPKTDRYGRTLEEADFTTPADSEPPADLAELDGPQPAGSGDPDAGLERSNDRYVRRAIRDPLMQQSADGDEMPVEESAEQDDLPSDERFAQRTGGISFEDDESGNTVDNTDANDGASHAPRFALTPADDRFGNERQHADPSDEEAGDLQETERDGGGMVLDPASDDETNESLPTAADRFADRFEQRRGQREMPADEASLDERQPENDDAPVSDRADQFQDAGGGSYTVEPNDNFWRISQKVYGTGAYFKALEEHNRRQLGNRLLLNVGDVISTPHVAELQRDYPSLSPKPREVPSGRRALALASSTARGGRTYTVLEGDTLFDIARQELGKASRWAEIYELNRDQLGEDFNYLAPGTRLALPSSADRSAPVATRPARDGYRR